MNSKNISIFYFRNIFIFIIFVSAIPNSYTFELDLTSALKRDFEEDFGQITFIPKYDDQQSESDTQAIDLFYGEIDHSSTTDKRIEWLKEFVDEERRLYPGIKIEINIVGESGSTLEHSSRAQSFIEDLKLKNYDLKYQELPSSLTYDEFVDSSKSENKKRKPSSAQSFRTLFTLIRATGTGAGTFLSIYYFEDVSLLTAFSLSLLPAIASGGLAYYSSLFGKYLNTTTWTQFFLESNYPFAKLLRKSFGIDGKSLNSLLNKYEKIVKKDYPHLSPKSDLFVDTVSSFALLDYSKQEDKKAALIAKLKGSSKAPGIVPQSEMFVRNWFAEVAYSAIAQKFPQIVAKIGDTSINGAILSTLRGATLGAIAQGLLETSIYKRKFQLVEELQQDILGGKKTFSNQKQLLEEIEQVLKYNAEIKHATFHPELVRIENWCLKRTVFLSLISVSAVGMEIAGIPAAQPILWTLTGGGVVYYSKVNGHYTKIKESKFGKRVIESMKAGKSKAQFYHQQYCARKFTPRN